MSALGIIIDIVLVAVVVIFSIIGYRKGFLKSVLSLFSWVVCIVASVFLAKYVATWLNGIHNFSGLIGNGIAKGLVSTNDAFAKQLTEFGSKAEIISALSGTNGLLLTLVKVVINNTAVDLESEATVASVVGEGAGHMCMIVISGILVFIVLKIAIFLLSKLFDNIARTKILGGVNKILGLAFGAIKGACIVVIFNIIAVALSLIPVINKTIDPIIQNNTKIESFVYNQTENLVEKYVIDGKAIQNWVDDLWASR